MQTTIAKTATPEAGLATYVIRGGKEGAARLNVLAQALAPSTAALLDRLGPLDGFTIIDAACGGGDVTVELARRAGPAGRVVGLDLDTEKLQAAADRARALKLANCRFAATDVTKPWAIRGANMVYARFIMTHLREPERLLSHAWNSLPVGGLMVVEDIDAEGMFWYPPSAAIETFRDLYVGVTRLKGCDPFIGRRLETLLEAGGYADIRTALVQPYGRRGAAKDVIAMTFDAIGDSVLAAGLVDRQELENLQAELAVYASRNDTTLSMPRIFQVWGLKR